MVLVTLVVVLVLVVIVAVADIVIAVSVAAIAVVVMILSLLLSLSFGRMREFSTASPAPSPCCWSVCSLVGFHCCWVFDFFKFCNAVLYYVLHYVLVLCVRCVMLRISELLGDIYFTEQILYRKSVLYLFVSCIVYAILLCNVRPPRLLIDLHALTLRHLQQFLYFVYAWALFMRVIFRGWSSSRRYIPEWRKDRDWAPDT